MLESASDVPLRLLTAAQVREAFGGISDMTLWRWLADPVLGFPRPIRINGRRFFEQNAIDAFLARRKSEAA